MVAFWLGCVGPTRVSMLPPMNGSSPAGEAIRPVTTTGNAPQRDSYVSHAADESPRAIAEVTIAALLVRLLAGATAPIMFGVFGAFDEDRLFDTPQLAPSPAARPAGTRRDPGCASFLCGPITLPR
ncbi:MAG TPA: hypothetical protein VNO33_01005 [Kofleriaceae bacterium]|nr:hypothetical protein [Kofleriaceae bacterium]